MTKEQKRIKSEELSKNQEKIIQIWKSGDKVLALILARSIMTDKEVLQFCIDSEINMANRNHMILVLRLHRNSFDIQKDGWVGYNLSNLHCQYYPPKNEKCILNNFRRWLNRVIGNKRIKK